MALTFSFFFFFFWSMTWTSIQIATRLTHAIHELWKFGRKPEHGLKAKLRLVVPMYKRARDN